MISTVIKCLKDTHKVSEWKVVEKNTESSELFYVKDKLQTNRASSIDEVFVTVYVEKHNKKGSSSFLVDPYLTKNDINKKINEAVNNALLSLNENYKLPYLKDIHSLESTSNLKDKPLNEFMLEIVPAIFRADFYKGSMSNATEIFLYKITTHIYNSNKTDVKFVTYKGNIEIIPSYDDEKGSYETYNMIEFSSLDTDSITKQVNESMKEVVSKADAIKMTIPSSTPVILHPGEIISFLDYFSYNLSYRAKYSHSSKFELGQDIQEGTSKDRLTISLIPTLETSASSSLVDNDGIYLKEVNLIDKGICKNLHGDFKYGYYLGIENVTGNISNYKVGLGSKTEEQLKEGPYLECVQFSDIQMDEYTGFFGGEVRLAYYFDGNKKIPVTGLSIQGNLEEIKSSLYLSSKEVKYKSYQGPSLLKTDKFKIL